MCGWQRRRPALGGASGSGGGRRWATRVATEAAGAGWRMRGRARARPALGGACGSGQQPLNRRCVDVCCFFLFAGQSSSGGNGERNGDGGRGGEEQCRAGDQITDSTGLSGALETLCGQGYGAKLYRMLGVYLQSSVIISTFFSIFISILWYFSESILIWLHQEPEVSKMAALYLKYLIPGLFAYGSLQCMLRFLQTQTVVMPLVICSIVPLVIHVALTYLTVHVFGLGFKGTSLSGSISLWISFIMLALYVKYSEKFRYTWEGFTAESFQHIIPCMKLAIPSAVMVCLEYWAFEILVLLAGLLPNSELSTSLIAMCVNTEAIAFMITYGFSAAVSTRVSNEIGAGNIEKAKNAVAVTLKLAVLLGVTVVLLLALGHDLWASLFSSTHEIIRAFAYMTPLLTVSIVLDSAQGVLSGVSRGCGWQHLAAWTNLLAFYAVGMPLSLLFSFKLALHAKGLWLGLICGLFCQTCALIFITLRTKWTRVDLSDKDGESNVLV